MTEKRERLTGFFFFKDSNCSRIRETVYSGLGTDMRSHTDRHMNRLTAGLGKVYFELSDRQ